MTPTYKVVLRLVMLTSSEFMVLVLWYYHRTIVL
jgi:hypothetical protein